MKTKNTIHCTIAMSFLNIVINLGVGQSLLPRNFEDHKEIEKSFDKFQKRILDRCFLDVTKPTLVAANWSDLSSKWLLQFSLKSLLLFGIEKSDNLQRYEKQIKRFVFNVNKPIERSWPISKIVIVNLSVDNLKLTLFKLKHTIFWNISGLFLVRMSTPNNCKFAEEYLKVIWDFNILSSVFMCYDSLVGVRAYTFNPYAKKETAFWRRVDDYEFKSSKNFTIFEGVHLTSAPCEEIWFDKTADLANYPLPIAAPHWILTRPNRANGKLKEVDLFFAPRQLLSLALHLMKARPEYTFYNSSLEAGEIDTDGVGSGIVAKVLEGRYEASTGPDYQRGLWRSELFTYMSAGLCYVTRRERLSLGSRLLRAFPPEVLVTLQLLVLASLPPFRRLLGLRSWPAAGLEVLRAVLGVGTVRRPRGDLGRVLLAACVFAFLVVNAFLQSQLSTMLATVDTASAEPRTAVHLVRDGYKIHARRYIRQNYWDITPLSSAGPMSSAEAFSRLPQCLGRMLRDERIACVEDCQFAKFFVHEDENLRVTREENFDTYKVLMLREDSPLRLRLESAYRRITQHGLVQHLKNLEALGYRKPWSIGYRRIKLRQLRYAFGLLAVGCALATLAFFAEIVKGSRKKLFGSGFPRFHL